MNPTYEETSTGTYTESFTQIEVGAFVTQANGRRRFVATGVSKEDARLKVEEYYRSMSRNPRNTMDMTDLDRISFKRRTVTFGVWRD